MKFKIKKTVALLLSIGLLASTTAMAASASLAVNEDTPVQASASARGMDASVLNDYVPLAAYGKNSQNDVFQNIGDGSRKGYFDNADPVTITKFDDNGYAYVTYQASSGAPREGFTKTSNFSSFSEGDLAWVSSNQTVYTSSNLSASWGYVSSEDAFFVVEHDGDAVQIIYILDNGTYKLAWIPANSQYSLDIELGFNVKTYTAQNGEFTTYTAPGTPGYTSSGWVDGTDEVTIKAFYKNGWCQITYPLTAGGTKTAYIPTSVFIPNGMGSTRYYPKETTNVLDRPNGKYYGYVDTKDQVILAGHSGSYAQIIYLTNSGTRKMGWVPLYTIL